MSHTISLPVVRFSLAGLLSLLITFLLFFFMQNLVKNTDLVFVEDNGPVPEFDFVRLQKDQPVTPRERVKPPTEIEDPPPSPQPKSFEDPDFGKTRFTFNDFDKHIPDNPIDPGIIAIGEGDILPIIKVQPNYPHSAIAKGIEGYVIVEFTVTTTGATRDIEIVDAEPDNIFNRVSILAAEKFKYKPRIINGTEVEVRGVRNKFIFKLE